MTLYEKFYSNLTISS